MGRRNTPLTDSEKAERNAKLDALAERTIPMMLSRAERVRLLLHRQGRTWSWYWRNRLQRRWSQATISDVFARTPRATPETMELILAAMEHELEVDNEERQAAEGREDHK